MWNNVYTNEEIEMVLEVAHPIHITARRVDDALDAK